MVGFVPHPTLPPVNRGGKFRYIIVIIRSNRHNKLIVMSNYRRNFTKGGSYFFTLTLADRRSSLLVDQIGLLRQSFRHVRQRHPFRIDAIVILPDHLHCIWTLPKGDDNYPTRWRLIKAAFSRQLPKTEETTVSRYHRGERNIWQRRYWEHSIRDETDFRHHVEYIHHNPVKHGYVQHPRDWLYSSYHHLPSGRGRIRRVG